jgi:large subunit ribosomal protein L7/L12
MNTRTWSPDIQILGDRIVGLTPVQAAELQKYLEAVHGIQSVSTPVGRRDDRDKLPPPPPPPPTEFRVVLEGFDSARKVGAIKVIRELLTLGIREAKEFVETPPRVVREGLTREQADQLKAQLEAAGVVVSVAGVVVDAV